MYFVVLSQSTPHRRRRVPPLVVGVLQRDVGRKKKGCNRSKKVRGKTMKRNVMERQGEAVCGGPGKGSTRGKGVGNEE